jgi:hypothetical protein
MRFSELAALRRDCLNLDAFEVRIIETLVQPDMGGLWGARSLPSPVSCGDDWGER